VPQDNPLSQVLTPQGADIHLIFPLLSVGGFAAVGGLLGAQWYLTKPGRRGRTL
jgi:hypothetical protein